MNLNNIFKASQVAEKLNLHEQTIRRRAKALGIEMVKVGSAYVFTADDVERIAAYSEAELPQPEPMTPNVDGLLTSKQAAATISTGMSASSFVRRARELGLYPVTVVEHGRQRVCFTPEQVNRFKAEYDPFLRSRKKVKQKGVAPFASAQIKVRAMPDELYTTGEIVAGTGDKPVTAKYLKLTNAAKPFDVSSLWG